jgi:hypothetical protein
VLTSLPPGGVSADEIGEALSRVLASEAFSSSKRLRRFLAYSVEKALLGEESELKEYSIALAVFDRDGSFDPRVDSIVRVEARRLRQQLAEYYQKEGQFDPLLIELPKGSYGPVFQYRGGAPPPIPRRPSRRVWYAAAALGGGLVVGAIVLWLTGIFPAARTPHHWRLAGSRLVVLDSQDRVCWEKQFPALNGDFDSFVRDKVSIEDIDGDGRIEVLFSFHPENTGDRSDALMCFDSAGMLRWEFRYGARKTFGSRSFDASYAGRFARPVKSGSKRYLLTVANHCLWYPAQVALLDPATGRLVEEYWHPGSIYHLALQDLDGDGGAEVLLGAINNPGDGLGHAGLAVLKIPFSSVPMRARKADDSLPPVTGGGELAYVLFPQPDVNRVMGTLAIMSRMLVDQNRRILVQTPLAESGGIVYYLDFDLKLQEYRFSDNFVSLHERYYRQGLLDHRLRPEETAALGRIARFDAAPDGNSQELERFWK